MKNFFKEWFGQPDKHDELNIPDAITAHVAWKVRLERYLSGTSDEQLDAASVAHDSRCKLGKWIYDPAQLPLHDNDEFCILRTEHALFHRCAGEIIGLMQAGKKDEANALLTGQYTQTSRGVINMLVELNELKESATKKH